MKTTKVSTDIVQWAVRSAFEEGYISASPYQGASKVNPRYGKWLDAWMKSRARLMLIQNGVISEDDDWR